MERFMNLNNLSITLNFLCVEGNIFLMHVFIVMTRLLVTCVCLCACLFLLSDLS